MMSLGARFFAIDFASAEREGQGRWVGAHKWYKQHGCFWLSCRGPLVGT